ncbi:T9SS type B sorting domain-containing protein [Nonlabens sp. SCSIO 43208]|uniref:T9SS type B sorting domain-containing protein n=1 Tax=Nonlabens sp. SCSIO 43208 TaxID=2793009 RepID=UPI003D6BA952
MKRFKFLQFFICLVIGFSSVAQNPNDCTNAILLCGNTDLGLTPSGAGTNDFASPNNQVPFCYDFPVDQAWFRVEIENTGSFRFDLVPDVAYADYDFAVFGPVTDCNNLGAAIRCSSTNPQRAGVSSNTGLNDTETDVTEGPGANGNGYLREIDATAGEVYYIIVGLAVGTGGFQLNPGGTATLPPGPIAHPVQDQEYCDNLGPQDGIREFDFTQFDATIINGQSNVIVTYHESLNDANIGTGALSFPYTNSTSTFSVFARIERTDSNCTDFTEFEIVVDENGIPNDLDEVVVCSVNNTESYDLAANVDLFVANASSYNITYHDTEQDAFNDTNPINPNVTATTTQTFYFLKVTDPAGIICDSVVRVPLRLYNPPVVQNPNNYLVCDIENDGLEQIILSDLTSEILGALDPNLFEVRHYLTNNDRSVPTNNLSGTPQISQPVTSIFSRVTDVNSGCFTDLDFNVVLNRTPDLRMQDPIIICEENTQPITIGVEFGFEFYEWSTGESGQDTNTIDVLSPGSYTVTVTNNEGCTSQLTIEALPSSKATIDEIITQDFRNGDNTATILVSGSGDYEFSVDDGAYQSSNFFDGLYKGYHDLRVRDRNGCGVIFATFVTLDYQRFFTPNQDGFNDYWTFDGLKEYPGAQLFIYDRHGKLLKQLSPDTVGWDGTYNGNPLPSSTYWFTLEIENRPKVSGNFALVR